MEAEIVQYGRDRHLNHQERSALVKHLQETARLVAQRAAAEATSGEKESHRRALPKRERWDERGRRLASMPTTALEVSCAISSAESSW